MNGRNRGALVGGTWLIGLGVVFLVRQAMDLSWGEAWPLFVILVGVASLITTLIDRRWRRWSFWSLTWPLVWIGVGVVLFLSTTGQLATGPGELIAEYWPWLLIILGVWFLIGALIPRGRAPNETLVVPLDGVQQATVRVRFGAGTLDTTLAAPGNLVDGRFVGGVVHRIPGPGHVELEQDTSYGMPWLERESAWTLGLTGEVPLDLRVEVGASRARLDLSGTKVRRLEVRTGASETTVILPRAAGMTDVKAEAGAASLTFIVPKGVAARIRPNVVMGSIRVDEERFPRFGGDYQSTDYGSAANRVDLAINGGVGSVRVIGED
ncbi:MAG TPA: hypothetical protein VFM38_12875 [Candidatus Limnocylindrales bacterium]|nr:hypothetical protein [Candidatus Limnocylindrales bacterium]